MSQQHGSSWRDVERRAVSLIDKGHLLQQQGQDTEALAAFEKAVAACRPLTKDSDAVALVMAQALDNKANALVDLNRLAEAILCFDEAIQVHERFVRGEGSWQDVREIGISQMNKARALMLSGRYPEAHACLDRAIERFEQCDSDEDLARAWLLLGDLRVREDQLHESLPALDQSLVYWDAVSAGNSNRPHPDHAYTLSSKADVMLCLGRYDEALDLSVRSVAIHRAVLERALGQRTRSSMAEAVNLQGHILEKLGRWQEAQDCYREAARLKDSRR